MNTEHLPSSFRRGLASLTLLLMGAVLTLAATQARAATFTVTSPDGAATGAGSLVWAIGQANGNPGTDTITFTTNLVVSVVDSPPVYGGPGFDPAHYYLGHITESVVFEGNGATLAGLLYWVGVDGTGNRFSRPAPGAPGSSSIITTINPGFIEVGTRQQNNAGIDVTVRNMHFDQLTSFANVRSNATLTVDSCSLNRIYDIALDGERPAIQAWEGASVTIKNTSFKDVINWGHAIQSFWVGAIAGIPGANRLQVENCRFSSSSTVGAINWGGNQAFIVNSQFLDAGGVNHFGGNMDIVNCVFDFFGLSTLEDQRIISQVSGGTLTMSACSVSVGAAAHSVPYELPYNPLVCFGSTFRLRGSAIGVRSPEIPGRVLHAEAGGVFQADAFTWIQPVAGQGDAALKTITGQPNLLTDAPGLSADLLALYPDTVNPLLGTSGAPGLLIDAIPDAAPGGTNELKNPIDNSTITQDALGHPRVDGNGRRCIGALQLVLSPHVTVLGATNGMVTLNWTRPQDPASGPITGYAILHKFLGGAITTRVAVANATNTTQTVSNLVNGTAYEFTLMATNAAGDGPPSNLVIGMPYGTVETPIVTAMPSNGVVRLTWTTPATGGGFISGYNVVYRRGQANAWEAGDYTTATQSVITGLQNRVTYEFGVLAVATGGRFSDLGIDQATPVESGWLVDPVWLSGEFYFRLLGWGNRSYRIEASTTLTNWPVVIPSTTLPANGIKDLLDTNTAGRPYRFYRAILLP
jgi:hypothetical protein